MGACTVCAKVFIIIVNIGVVLFGVIFAALGGILQWGESVIAPQVTPMLDGIIQPLSQQTGSPVTSSEVIHYLFVTLQNCGIMGLFFVGIIFLTVAIFGFVAACCNKKIAMIVYIILNGALIFVGVLLIILYFLMKADFEKKGEDYMFAETQKFTGVNATNAESLVLNLVHAELKCCGAKNGEDYKTAKNWNRNITDGSGNTIIYLQYPLTCCKLENYVPIDRNCSLTPSVNNSNHEIGCYAVLKAGAGLYMIIGAIAMVAVCLCQALLIAAALAILRSHKKVDPDDSSSVSS